MQNVGLQQTYDNDQELALYLRMLCTVAFLPPADVIQGFEELVEEIRNIYNDEVDELLNYFEDNFIGCFREMHLVVLHRLHWIYGTRSTEQTCSTEQTINSLEQTTA